MGAPDCTDLKVSSHWLLIPRYRLHMREFCMILWSSLASVHHPSCWGPEKTQTKWKVQSYKHRPLLLVMGIGETWVTEEETWVVFPLTITIVSRSTNYAITKHSNPNTYMTPSAIQNLTIILTAELILTLKLTTYQLSAFQLNVTKSKPKQFLRPITSWDRNSAMCQSEFEAITCKGVRHGKMCMCNLRSFWYCFSLVERVVQAFAGQSQSEAMQNQSKYNFIWCSNENCSTLTWTLPTNLTLKLEIPTQLLLPCTSKHFCYFFFSPSPVQFWSVPVGGCLW